MTTTRDSDTVASTPPARLEGRPIPSCPLGFRTINSFLLLGRIGKGSYGVVYLARDKATGETVAIKKARMEETSARVIECLWKVRDPAIVQLKEVVLGGSNDNPLTVYMVMEYVEHDLASVLRSMPHPFDRSRARDIMSQLLGGVSHLHNRGVIHRDLKTANLLMTRDGRLKICDFGLCRLGVLHGHQGPYTKGVGTLWYQAPELLLGAAEYSAPVDMWAVGCIMAELLGKEPLFSGRSEMDQMSRIIEVLGIPDGKMWPELKQLPGAAVFAYRYPYSTSMPEPLQQRFPLSALSLDGLDLLTRLLTYNPKERITADAALRHRWFRSEHRDPTPQEGFSLFSKTPF